MQSPITLNAGSETDLQRQIDEKLKQGYLIRGDMEIEGDQFRQVMVQPNNIDPELTLAGGIKLLVFGVIYFFLLYLVFTKM
jgi:hypothetical protein